MEKQQFIKKHQITEDQFFGKEKISGYLYLSGLTSIPEGFNPTVGGDLDLSGLTSIPEGFNPTVGGSLYLRGLTSIPEGFNPTVGGYLDLSGLTSIPEGFNPTVGGSLDLSGLTSIPEGFNPTVGGYLDLSGLTSIPEGFNPTVGGDLYYKNNSKHIGTTALIREIPRPRINKNFFWNKNGKKYAMIDGIFCEILTERKLAEKGESTNIYSARKVNKAETFFIVNKGYYYAHGSDLHAALDDVTFKIVAEKLKKEPINFDTEITVNHYRLLTGACDLGCRNWLDANNIPYEVVNGKAVEISAMKAIDLLPILKKSNAYGLEIFEKLITF